MRQDVREMLDGIEEDLFDMERTDALGQAAVVSVVSYRLMEAGFCCSTCEWRKPRSSLCAFFCRYTYDEDVCSNWHQAPKRGMR